MCLVALSSHPASRVVGSFAQVGVSPSPVAAFSAVKRMLQQRNPPPWLQASPKRDCPLPHPSVDGMTRAYNRRRQPLSNSVGAAEEERALREQTDPPAVERHPHVRQPWSPVAPRAGSSYSLPPFGEGEPSPFWSSHPASCNPRRSLPRQQREGGALPCLSNPGSGCDRTPQLRER